MFIPPPPPPSSFDVEGSVLLVVVVVVSTSLDTTSSARVVIGFVVVVSCEVRGVGRGVGAGLPRGMFDTALDIVAGPSTGDCVTYPLKSETPTSTCAAEMRSLRSPALIALIASALLWALTGAPSLGRNVTQTQS